MDFRYARDRADSMIGKWYPHSRVFGWSKVTKAYPMPVVAGSDSYYIKYKVLYPALGKYEWYRIDPDGITTNRIGDND